MALIIFDLDGTLVDSIVGIGNSMNRVLDSFGYPLHTKDKYKAFVGNGIRRLVELALPPKAAADEFILNKAYEMMLQIYQEHYGDGLAVYDGIYEVLEQLTDSGHRLAVLTNKHESMAKPIAKRWFGDYPFEMVIGSNENRPKKPDPTAVQFIMEEVGIGPEDTVYVGDSEVDLMTARNAGIKEVIVSWGFRNKRELEILRPENLIDNPIELMHVIEGGNNEY